MDTVKYSFSAGEFAEELWGRTDLEFYDLGAKRLENVVVNFGGGAFKRRGTVFAEFLQHPEATIRSFAFKFSRDLDNTYVVIFGSGYVRFMQGGSYILESAITLDSFTAGVASLSAHGYVDGDLVYIEGLSEIGEVMSATANSFKLRSLATGLSINFTAGPTPTAQRVFTLPSPYATAHLRTLTYSQYLDEVRLTHRGYPTYILTRTSSTWTLEPEVKSGGTPLPGTPVIEDSGAYIQHIKVIAGDDTIDRRTTPLTITDPTGTGFYGEWLLENNDFTGPISGINIVKPGRGYTSPSVTIPTTDYVFEVVTSDTEAGYIVAVSAIMDDGTETGIMRPAIVRDSINFTQTKGSATYTWAAVEGATKYNVYRSIVVPDGSTMHLGYSLGFIGTTRGTSFTDNNITPDFTRTPALYRDPFAPGAVEWIEVTNGGSGYNDTGSLALTGGGGSGFVGYPIVTGGKVIGAYIAHPGSGYTSPSVSVTGGGGSGATFVAHLAPNTGRYPATSFRFQSRYGYAGTPNQPMTIWASRPNELTFAEFEYPIPDDPYEYTIDSEEVTPIRHALAMQQGLLLFTPSGVAVLRASDGTAVTGKNGFLDPQSAIGVSPVVPVRVGEDVIYVQEKYRGVQQLSPADSLARKYVGKEISILSRHIFDGREIVAFNFAYLTEKLGFGVFRDGTLFALTLDRDQNVSGFARGSMRGYFRDVVSVDVGNEEHLYFQEEVEINGQPRKFMAMMLPEVSEAPEDAIYLDGCISTEKRTYEARVRLSGTEGEITVTANLNIFTEDVVGQVFWAGGGRGFVVAQPYPAQLIVQLTRPVTRLKPNSDEPEDCAAGEWWLNPLVSTVSGIPYEGCTVSVVADGSVLPDQVVVNGSITLPQEAAIIHVGFSYKMELETLPIVAPDFTVEGKNVTTREVTAKFKRAGAFTVGRDHGYEVSLRTDEAYAEPTRQGTRDLVVPLNGGWEPNGTVVFRQENGLPFELTQLVVRYDAGG